MQAYGRQLFSTNIISWVLKVAAMICTPNIGQVIKRLIWNEFGILPDSFLLVLA